MSRAEHSVLNMEFPVEVWLASKRIRLGRLLDLKPGDEVPLPAGADEQVDLVANGVTLASGELVVVEGKFGIRVTRTAAARLANLHGDAPDADTPDGDAPDAGTPASKEAES